ncbi:MAG: TetR/AcrR family transcriptional regulator [Gulosibacter sp.]|uniref:TetR/AcrR family transcriptional regulator n=1 Tax=Gulosibacter sp. TaxID=2817531 RepID=UPI003F9098D1
MSRRSKLLETFRDLVLNEGERAATLDAVAATAGVSKGGLLYHFGSRAALVDALREHFEQLVTEDLERMRDEGHSPSSWYLRTTVDYSSELERTMAALVRIAPAQEGEVRDALRAARDRWHQAIVDEIGDEQMATVIILLGDGIAYNAELEGGVAGSDSRFAGDREVEHLEQIIAGLRTIRNA